jgi:hypothetical protein
MVAAAAVLGVLVGRQRMLHIQVDYSL